MLSALIMRVINHVIIYSYGVILDVTKLKGVIQQLHLVMLLLKALVAIERFAGCSKNEVVRCVIVQSSNYASQSHGFLVGH